MAESAVVFLLDTLYAVLRDELNLLGGLKQEVEFMKHELENLKEFLKVADAKEDDTSLKEPVRELREITYDIHDVLDKCMLGFRPRQGTNGCGRFLNKVMNLKFRRQIASEIETLNSRLSNFVNSLRRYRELHSGMEQGSSSQTEGYAGRGDAFFSEDEKIVGFDKPEVQLKEWVYKSMNSGRDVISVVGMGGLGKTTLVKKVYDDKNIISLFDRHVWMVVSDYKNNIKHFFHDLIDKLVGETMESQPQLLNKNIVELREIVHGFLHQKKYIIVLDDVSELSTWDAIESALPRKDGHGCIIITARNHNIGTHACGETNHVYDLKLLSKKKAKQLFFNKAFPKSSCPDDLLVFAKSIVKRCAGLPLAIIVIGSLLAKKEKSAYEWDLFNRSISHELEGGDDLARLRRLFAVSYNDLPNHLKYCFSYLSIFPEGGLLETEKMLRLWAAEGFVQLEQNLSLEEVANKYLNELCSRSLLQVAVKHDDGCRVRAYRIHDLLRDYITSISRDHNFVTVCYGQQDQLWPNKIRRLAIQNNSAKLHVETINVEHLRSLILSNGDMEIRMIKDFVTRCRLLNVLDLRGSPIESIPDEVFRLYHLKYLCLRDTEIKLIPKSIKKLVNLETLDLKNTNVIHLPKEILKLQRLRHLLVYKYNVSDWNKIMFGHMQSFRAPYNIGDLQSLQKLCFLEADGVIVREIGKLAQLRRLGIAKLRSEHGKILCSSIANLTSLRSLTIGSSEKGENLDIDYPLSSEGLPFLRALFLSGYMDKVPRWISSLQSLSTLHLRWSKLRLDNLDSDPLTSLQGLPNLTCLLIQDVDVKGLSFKADGFQKLKVLRLYDMQKMKWIEVEKGSMPSLHEWDVCNCELLTEVPRGIEHLNILKYLGFHDMEKFKNMLVEGRRREGDSWRLARVTHIYFSSVREDEVREYSSLDDY